MRRAWVLFVLCVQAALATAVRAQEKPEPPGRSASLPADSVATRGELPKIDLPEFLITGNESIQLPQFDKTAIDEQKVFDASSRRFGPGTREPSGVQFEGSGKVPGTFAPIGEDMSGKVLAGYGAYATPYFDGWFGRTSPSFDFLLKGGFKSSRGHIPNAGYRSGHSSLSGGFSLPDDAGVVAGGRVHASIGLQGDGYRLYASPSPARERTVTRFMAETAINSDVEDLFAFSSGFYIRTATVRDSLRTAETSVGFEFAGDRDLGDVAFNGELGLWRNFYAAPSALWDPYYVQTGLSARYQIAEQLDILGGLRFYLVRGSDTKSVGRVYPRLGISWYATRRLTAFAKFEPYVQRNTLSSMVEWNPYITTDLRLRNQEFFTNFSMGIEVDAAAGVRTKLAVNYRRARNYPVFVDTAAIRLWSPAYDGTVRIISLDADLYADATDRDNLGASLSVRSSRSSISDKSVPYLPMLLVSGLYQHRFPFGLTLGTTMQVIGSQYADLEEQRSLAAFTLWDVKAEYALAPRWVVTGAVQNLLDQKQVWWEGYAGLPRTASLGMSYTW
jgi:hypothetical protein